jgi:hypothetical protein
LPEEPLQNIEEQLDIPVAGMRKNKILFKKNKVSIPDFLDSGIERFLCAIFVYK